MTATRAKRFPIAIVGSVGLPAKYGGFETLTANLVAYHDQHDLPCDLTVYCSSKAYTKRLDHYGGARLRYIPFNANGASSIIYDIMSIIDAIRRRDRVILILGVSGAIILPLIRLISGARLVVNIDGLEWKRPKWSRWAAAFLKFSEKLAVRCAHVVVADNRGIVDHVRDTYGRDAVEIPYGGDHATEALSAPDPSPDRYALMLCRIEPENHIHLILEAFDHADALDLVAVGNWEGSEYGRALRARYANNRRIRILDPIFDKQRLVALRSAAALYVHGHSAGGTNPALVEMMHFATPVVAFDCNYNRYTTENVAVYFHTADTLAQIVRDFEPSTYARQGIMMREIAERRYTWSIVGCRYFAAMGIAT